MNQILIYPKPNPEPGEMKHRKTININYVEINTTQ